MIDNMVNMVDNMVNDNVDMVDHMVHMVDNLNSYCLIILRLILKWLIWFAYQPAYC